MHQTAHACNVPLFCLMAGLTAQRDSTQAFTLQITREPCRAVLWLWRPIAQPCMMTVRVYVAEDPVDAAAAAEPKQSITSVVHAAWLGRALLL